MFMADVLIPLAAQTNAIVLCNAVHAECHLSTSFTRMYKAKRPQWKGDTPFTVLSTTCDMGQIYTNTNKHAAWREVRRQCRAWRQRDKKITPVSGINNSSNND